MGRTRSRPALPLYIFVSVLLVDIPQTRQIEGKVELGEAIVLLPVALGLLCTYGFSRATPEDERNIIL